MRTTLQIDDDVLDIARSLAASRQISVGEAVSFLARRGARPQFPIREVNGFHVFDVSLQDAPSFGPEDIERAEAQADLEYNSQFAKRSA
jgi:hypothetical protein